MSGTRFDDYWEEDFPGQAELWQQAVSRAMSGRRGQAVLRELRDALQALPQPRLISGALCQDGEVCALGAYAARRMVGYGLSLPEALRLLEIMDGVREGQPHEWAPLLDLRQTLAWAVSWENDEGAGLREETPEARYARVLAWVEYHIID